MCIHWRPWARRAVARSESSYTFAAASAAGSGGACDCGYIGERCPEAPSQIVVPETREEGKGGGVGSTGGVYRGVAAAGTRLRRPSSGCEVFARLSPHSRRRTLAGGVVDWDGDSPTTKWLIYRRRLADSRPARYGMNFCGCRERVG